MLIGVYHENKRFNQKLYIYIYIYASVVKSNELILYLSSFWFNQCKIMWYQLILVYIFKVTAIYIFLHTYIKY